MRLLAIDPGPEQSAWVAYHPDTRRIAGSDIEPNETLLKALGCRRFFNADHLAIEMITSYGMPVGKSVFETCVWIGRLIEASHQPHTLIYRQQVKLHLCNSVHAKDSNIRQAIMDLYGSTRQAAIGTKKAPGPLYGFKKDIWSAMGVALTWAAQNGQGELFGQEKGGHT